MIIPFITLLKIIALGSIKLIFLLFGMAFFPVFALRFILGGATGLLLPTLDWLESQGRLDAQRHEAILADLDELINIKFSRSEARALLWKLIRKMLANSVSAIRRSTLWMLDIVRKPFS